MTDEEKAEKFVKENCCEFCINKEDCEMGYIDCYTKEGVLYGLAKGRKESGKALRVITKEKAELKAFCSKLIQTNNELRKSLRKYEIVPDVDYLPNGVEVYKENVGDNPYGVK